MGVSLERLGSVAFRLLDRLLAWHFGNWQKAWSSAWHGPYWDLRLLGLGLGLFITWILIPATLDDLELMRGASYLFALYMALSNATFIKIAKVGRDCYLPLGLVAPVFILLGVIGSNAIRPMIGDARDAAMAQDFMGALVILVVFAVMTLRFRLSQSVNP